MGFTRNIENDRALLGKLINRLGLPVTVLSLLLAHAEAVRDDGRRLGLISPGDVELVIARHTADSLLFALARTPQPGERWLDVGSGAGFPGLVLACVYPNCSFTLLEPLRRRAGFLQLAALELGLANVTVDDRRLGELAGQRFDVAVARAVQDPNDALPLLLEVLREGGDALVAVGPSFLPTAPARLVRIEGVGFVDSPGRFSMMTRGG